MADELKIEPCPFCKGRCLSHHCGNITYIKCARSGCCYNSANGATEAEAIAAHNTVSRNSAAAPDLRDYANAVEAWEADLLMDDSVWVNGLPVFTQALYDRWMELQAMRNKVLAKARGEGHD